MNAVLKLKADSASIKLKEAKAVRAGIQEEIKKAERTLMGAQDQLAEAKQWQQKYQDAADLAQAAHVEQRDAWLASGRVGAEPAFVEASVEGSPFGTLGITDDAVANAEADVLRIEDRLAGLKSRLKASDTEVGRHASAIRHSENEIGIVDLAQQLESLYEQGCRLNANDLHLRGDAPPKTRAAFETIRWLQGMKDGIHKAGNALDPEMMADQATKARIAKLSFD